MTMTVSQKGKDFIKGFESLHDGNPKTSLVEPMLDPIGIPTIGYGNTIYQTGKRVTLDDPALTMEQVEELFDWSCDEHIKVIQKYVKVELTQGMIDALASFIHNFGETKFAGSTLLKKLNTKCWTCVGNEFMRWIDPHNPRTLVGLTRRRAAEKVMFFS